MFGDDPRLGWRDIAYFCEDADAMRVGPHSGSFVATAAMDPDVVDQCAPLVAAMLLAAAGTCRSEGCVAAARTCGLCRAHYEEDHARGVLAHYERCRKLGINSGD